MSYFDLIVAVPLLWAGFQGFKKGLIIELASLIALLFGIYGAIGFSDFTGQYLVKFFSVEQKYLSLIAFVITFLAIVVAVYALAKILERVVKLAALGIVNRIAGLVFSVSKVLLILSFIIYLSDYVFLREKKKQTPPWLKDSLLYQPLQKAAGTIFPGIIYLIKNSDLERAEISKDELLKKIE